MHWKQNYKCQHAKSKKNNATSNIIYNYLSLDKFSTSLILISSIAQQSWNQVRINQDLPKLLNIFLCNNKY